MNLKRGALGIFLGISLALASSGFAGGKPKGAAFKPTRPYVEGEILVQYRNDPESFESREVNQKIGGTVLKVQKKMNLALVQLPPGMDTVKGVERYRREPGVLAAEPNYVISPLKKAPAGKKPAKKRGK